MGSNATRARSPARTAVRSRANAVKQTSNGVSRGEADQTLKGRGVLRTVLIPCCCSAQIRRLPAKVCQLVYQFTDQCATVLAGLRHLRSHAEVGSILDGFLLL